MSEGRFVPWMLTGMLISVEGLLLLFIVAPRAKPNVGAFVLGLFLRWVLVGVIILIVIACNRR